MRYPAEERRWNPFSWRLEEFARLHRMETRHRRRAQLAGELLLAEAEEAACGVRHMSVVHGRPWTARERAQVMRLRDVLQGIAQYATWYRLRGGDDHVIVAVAGQDAGRRTDQLIGWALAINPGHWRVVASARPDLGPLDYPEP